MATAGTMHLEIQESGWVCVNVNLLCESHHLVHIQMEITKQKQVSAPRETRSGTTPLCSIHSHDYLNLCRHCGKCKLIVVAAHDVNFEQFDFLL